MKGYFRKRGSKWSFSVDIGKDPITGKRKQKTLSGFKTKKEAEKACAELIAEVENGEYFTETGDTLGEYLEQYLENVVKNSVAPSTFEIRSITIRTNIIKDIGYIKLKDLTAYQLQSHYNKKIDSGKSRSYVKNVNDILKQALDVAVSWKLIKDNVAKLVKLPTAKKETVMTWTIEESNRFLDYAKKTTFFKNCRGYYILYLLALSLGIRKGEALALKWIDIDFNNSIAVIRRNLVRNNKNLVLVDYNKTSTSRRNITIPEFALDELYQHKIEQNKLRLMLGSDFNSNGLIVTSDEGHFINPNRVNEHHKTIVKIADLPKITFHELRHTHLSTLLQLGENPKAVAERAGHATVNILLNTYAHVMPNMQEDLAKNFNNAMKIRKT